MSPMRCLFLLATFVPVSACIGIDVPSDGDCSNNAVSSGASLIQRVAQRVDVSELKFSERILQPTTPEWLSELNWWKISTIVLAGVVFVFGALLWTGKTPPASPVENRSPPRESAQPSFSPAPRSMLGVIEEKKQLTASKASIRRPSVQSGRSSADGDVEEIDDPANDGASSQRIQKYLDDNYRSRKIFIRIVTALAQVWGVLALMYWSLLTQQHQLMNCYGNEGAFVTHACTYTKACLRGFPVLAANVTLVMTVRILLQRRIYYSLLQKGYVLDFADTHVWGNSWPWICAFSMSQGGLHLLLKMYYDQDRYESGDAYLNMARKFVLPGYIFLVFFLRYVDVEECLIPLNRLVERDYTTENRHCSTLASVLAMDERVVAFDVRHRDIIGECESYLGRQPTLDDVFNSVIDGYEAAHIMRDKHVHHHWGLFRSLWPASVLVDKRLDWKDFHTREWLISFLTLLGACCLFACVSLLFFIRNIWENFSTREFTTHRTPLLLAQAVLVCHGFCVVLFLHHTVHGMFFFALEDHLKPEHQKGSASPSHSTSSRSLLKDV